MSALTGAEPVISRSTMNKGHKYHLGLGDKEVEFHSKSRLHMLTKQHALREVCLGVPAQQPTATSAWFASSTATHRRWHHGIGCTVQPLDCSIYSTANWLRPAAPMMCTSIRIHQSFVYLLNG